MGELEGPAIWRLEFGPDPKKHWVVTKLSAQPRDAFFSGVAKQVAQSEAKQVLVFIHGFNTTFVDAARRSAQIAYDLGFGGVPMLFSWPSHGRRSLRHYNMDARNNALSVDALADFLDTVAARAGAGKVSIIAHSMGNRALTEALKTIAARNPNHRAQFQQIALMAPDMDARLFQNMAAALASTANRLTLYVSERDGALLLSRANAGYGRLGEGGKSLVVIKDLDTVDASAVDTSILGLFHTYFADNKTILSDLFYLIRGHPAKDRHGLERMVLADGRAYWKFRPAAR
jgi:esterase/lipase superfamily enzyme